MKKKIKYILIIVVVIGGIYAKRKIDSNNNARIQMLDNLDDGSLPVKHK